MDKDELIKALQELEIGQSEIDEIILKAEKDGKFKIEDKKEDEKTIDEVAADQAENKEDAPDKDDMKKAFDKIMSAKADIDKSMNDFLNKYGNAPGIKTPDTDIETVKSEKEDIQKSEVNDFEKAFGNLQATIEKSFNDRFETQTKVNEELVKSLQNINQTVEKIAQTPLTYKSMFDYNKSILEKGEKDSNGKTIVSLRDKESVIDYMEKSIDKVDNEKDKQLIRDNISNYSIANKISPEGIQIVSKAMNIDIVK